MSLSFTNLRHIGTGLTTNLHIDGAGTVLASAAQDAQVIDCDGAYISNGWADLHVHVWYGGTDISVRPEQAGMNYGVTAMADAGSAGEASFHGLREYILDPQHEVIKAFLNIGSIGLTACGRIPELIDHRFIDIERSLKVIEANRDVICGIKVRASGAIVGDWGIEPLKIGRHLAEMTDLPLMVHIGEAPPLVSEVFDLLRPGDVVTHCFNGKATGKITATAALFAQAVELAGRGVHMDVGHGAASFDFEVATKVMADGFKPFSISTDVHARNINGPVFDLATTASKLLSCGLSLEDCIAAITTNPRSFLGISSTNIEVGASADFTIFTVDDCDIPTVDSGGNTRRLTKMIQPQHCVLGNKWVQTPTNKVKEQNHEHR